MADTVADVHSAVRALVGVGETNEVFDDETLFPYTKIAYRKAARALRGAGMGLFQKQSSNITVTAGVTAIVRPTGSPSYPADLLRPIRLREKPAGETYFKRMNSSDGFIPDRAAGTSLQIWDWRNDTILVPAASIDSTVQILYEASLAALVDPSSTIAIPDAADPLSKMVASMVARSRDELNSAGAWWTEAMEDLAQIAASEKNTKAARGAAWGE
jgi:hypothetical protein